MKIFLYFLSIHQNDSNYVEVSFEKISQRTGVHANNIAGATTFLKNINLLKNSTFITLRGEEKYAEIHRYDFSNGNDLTQRYTTQGKYQIR